MSHSIQLASTEAEIARCFPVMSHLRPALSADEFVARIRTQQAQGYHLAMLESGGEPVTVAGFRITEILASGRTLYVDDLVTSPGHRSHGFGKLMLDWLEAHARASGCETLSLDSGTHRQDAHAFYLRERLRITSFHFARKLT